MPVEVFHWNPKQRRWNGRFTRYVRSHIGHVSNFGDLLGPLIVERILQKHGLKEQERNSRLLSVGSILHFAQDGDTVWGSGVLGEKVLTSGTVPHLDVRAVRGPLTRAILQRLGHDVPIIYGDPGLLMSRLWSKDEFLDEANRSDYVIVPNYREHSSYRHLEQCVNPQADMREVLGRIVSADHVIASSLHGLIVAESFGIPATFIAPATLDLTKYWDYYLGTGRDVPEVIPSLSAAIDHPGEPALKWDPQPLLDAFPADLWADPEASLA